MTPFRMIIPLLAGSDSTRPAFCGSTVVPYVIIIMFPGSLELLACDFMTKFILETEQLLSGGLSI